MDGGAWWAAVYGVAQSRTRLKRLSSSSSEVKGLSSDLASPGLCNLSELLNGNNTASLIKLLGTSNLISIMFTILKCSMKSESEIAQSCPTLCDPMDYSPPGSSVHGIFQARILEWVALSFSRRSSQLRDWTWVSHIAGRCFTVWATREVQNVQSMLAIIFLIGITFILAHSILWSF